MTKRIVTYIVLVGIFTAVGIVVSTVFFGEQTQLPLETKPIQPKKPVSSVGSHNNETPQKKVSSSDIKVVSITGDAKRSIETGEQWEPLQVGSTLATNNKIATGDNSKLTLRIGEKSKLELAPRGILTVGTVSEQDRKFKLNQGQISVEYKEKDRRLRIENEDGSAYAETEEGIFSVLSSGTTVAVATKTGSVSLMSGDNKVIVKDGQQSVARGGIVTKPSPIPVDVLLRVVDPGCRTQREKSVVLKGRVTPGSRVTANSVLADTKLNGRFSVKVPLKVGKNNIVVATVDPSGRNKTRNFPCITVDPNAPIERVNIQWGPPEKQTGP